MAKPPRRRRKQRSWGWLVGVFAVAASLGAGMRLGAFERPVARPTTPPLVQAAQAPLPSPSHAGGFALIKRLETPMNVLVMACDVEYEEKHGHSVLGLTGNTDSMMLARLDTTTGKIHVLSIPRDTRVPIPGHGTFKINACNPYGGPALARQVVSRFLGVPVDHYVLFNTHAVIQLVNAMGGIDMVVPKSLNYDDYAQNLHIHLHRGYQHLDGQHAQDFLRFRHDQASDIGRIARLQAFLRAIMVQYMTPANILRTPELLKIAHDNVQTDLNNEDLLQIVHWAKDLKAKDLAFETVPGEAGDVGRVSYWLADRPATRRLVRSFLHIEPGAPL